MKFFLDTANIEEIREAAAMGFLDGATTNPSLVAKTGKKFRQVAEEICAAVDGPVSLEVVSTEYDGMMAEARDLARIAKNVVIKLPLTRDGLKATKSLSADGTRVNVTLCFAPLQALFAAKAGAAYISPFVGRLDDRGQDGMEVVQQIRTIYDNFGFSTEILVASVRHPIHVLQAALMGADVATMPFDVFGKMIQHPLTDSGLQQFLKDWQKVPR